MVHAHSCGWVGRRAEDGTRRVEDLEAFCVVGVGIVGCCGGLVGVGVGVGVSLLGKIFPNQVWEVWVANPLTEAMQAVWVVWGYR